ncbi:MAG TPA: hypothetical protein VEW67_05075 [Thermoleophilaceae bacterium]|nr:hypothetical protein [Thermoleophilaceae bacterium]
MFPRLRQQILARVDLIVEFSTLGEYGVDEDGGVMALDPEPTPARLAPRVRDRCGDAAPSYPSATAVASGCVVRARP